MSGNPAKGGGMVVGYVARFQGFAKETHVQAVKRILKYLKVIMSFGLWYPRCYNFTLTTYPDADWGGSIDDRKSTSGGAFFVGGCLVSWLRKKNSSISLSIVEAEYIATVSCCTQVIWMKHTLQDFKVEYAEPISIL
ncbi:secreted RxLR effector protein 161-like [Cryptomeria japonica]|uniref:secreted RxLR effector protein 161-like n=1 Tax=Cryptomeria japonica TaxID=3369 RepID=UPI0027DA5859|nr:secreted RxLR effector protein 161-like [Cryptomeria japonica]